HHRQARYWPYAQRYPTLPDNFCQYCGVIPSERHCHSERAPLSFRASAIVIPSEAEESRCAASRTLLVFCNEIPRRLGMTFGPPARRMTCAPRSSRSGVGLSNATHLDRTPYHPDGTTMTSIA